MHAAVGALEGKEAAVFGSDLGVRTGGTHLFKVWCKYPNAVLLIQKQSIYTGCLTEQLACSKDLQPCLLMLAAASDLCKKGDLILVFCLEQFLCSPRSEEKLEVKSSSYEIAPTVWSTRIKPRLAGRPSRSANQKILSSAGHQRKLLF